MQLNIKPIHFDGADCFLDSILSLTIYYNREYELTYSDLWDFKWLPEDPMLPGYIGYRIIDEAIFDRCKFNKYCCIDYSLSYINSFDEFRLILQGEIIKNLPIIIHINTFWCPWHYEYKIKRNSHFCMVVGLDQFNLYCIDPILNTKINQLSNEDFIKGMDYYYKFDVWEPVNNFNYGNILYESVNKIINNNHFDNIHRFADRFEKQFDYSLEYKDFTINALNVPMHINLGVISGMRKMYSTFLKHISKQIRKNNLCDFVLQMDSISSKWNSVKGILVKSCFKEFTDECKVKIVSLIREIAEMEERLATRLFNQIKGNNSQSIDTCYLIKHQYDNFQDNNIRFIDISSFYNSNAFSNTIENEDQVDFTGTGHCFLSEGLPSLNTWNIEHMVFLFPNISKNLNNNISCQNQNIKIYQGRYKSIMLLACAEWGNFSDYLILEYNNKVIEKVFISFSDWFFEEPCYNELIAWEGKVIEKHGEKYNILKRKFRIFAKEFNICKEEFIDSIILPNCPNIHIFAISMSCF